MRSQSTTGQATCPQCGRASAGGGGSWCAKCITATVTKETANDWGRKGTGKRSW